MILRSMILCAAFVGFAVFPASTSAAADAATRQLAHDLFRELIEINKIGRAHV